MIDAARVRDLLDRLGEEIAHLRRLAGYPPQGILSDPDRMAAVKYRFVVAIEMCIDIGEHIIASEALRAPTSFADVFAALGESGFVSPANVPTLQEMARFRNLLVHSYSRVDDRRVLEILRTRVGDFDTFREEIARALVD